MSEANERWRSALDDWRLPTEILDAAPESPWEFPVGLFEKRADASRNSSTPSNESALEALPHGGSVLDVGCGAGAASLPLTRRAKRLVGVDSSPRLLAEFRKRAEAWAAETVAIEGTWPEVEDRIEVADVVVCHHVAYNVPDLARFALALTRHARRRVVLELTLHHPMSDLNPLWLRFHDLKRPDHPSADDAELVLREAGLTVLREDWSPDDAPIGLDRRQMVAWTRRRLCLTPDRDPELEEAMTQLADSTNVSFGLPLRRLVTFHWQPTSAS
ncbi:MAG: class I SAM-dependent methyltransferase [Candidatus Dormibacteraceae bacterium]